MKGISVVIAGPCVAKPRHEHTDRDGRIVVSDLKLGACRIDAPIDARNRAAKEFSETRLNGPTIDIGIGISGSAGGSQRPHDTPRDQSYGEQGPRGTEPSIERGGSHGGGGGSSTGVGGGLSIGIPLGGGSNKPATSSGGAFLLSLQSDGRIVQRGTSCCGSKRGPSASTRRHQRRPRSESLSERFACKPS